MLDPELFDQLAQHPHRNAPEVNLALAEEGHGGVLLALARSDALSAPALTVIGQRIDLEGARLEPSDEQDEDGDDEPLLAQLDRLLVRHPNAPGALRDTVLSRHDRDPFYVLAAASHVRATSAALERAAAWPSRFAVFDRLWLPLLSPDALAPLLAEAWSQDPQVLLREAVARISRDQALLARLAEDPARQVRRAVASNPCAGALRERLATADPAAEVRARAAGSIGEHRHEGPPSFDSARFAAALRSMESGGVLAPDVASALSRSEEALDEEGALLAACVLPATKLVDLIRQCSQRAATPADVGLAAGMALRRPEESGGEQGHRELVAEVVKALSTAPDRFGELTGKARLAAWLGDGLACCSVLAADALVVELCAGVIGAESPVLSRAVVGSPARVASLCECASRALNVPPAVLELAWHDERISDEQVIAMAKRLVRAKRRGRDLPDDEIDLDPSRRRIDTLEAVVLSVSRQVTVSPRTALTVVALDKRRVRYVLTAMPQWRGALKGSMLARVLRQNAGALSAARAEARSRSADVHTWTERIMSDTEMAVALGLGHFTAHALVERIAGGRHKLEDGVSVAAGADARAVLEGAPAIKPLLSWAARQRSDDGAALALWLLLEGHDRPRPAGMIASSIDSLSERRGAVPDAVAEALAVAERRRPGRLESLMPNTPRGKAALASAIARAYRAIGGLRDER